MSQPALLSPHPYGVGDVVQNSVKILRGKLKLFLGLTLLPVAFLIGTLTLAFVAFAFLGGAALIMGLSSGSSRRLEAALASAGLGLTIFFVLYFVAFIGYMLLTLVSQGRMVIATLDTLDGRPSTMASLKEATPGLMGRAAALVGLGMLAYVAFTTVISVFFFAIAAAAGMSAASSRSSGAGGALGALTGLFMMVLYVGLIVGAITLSVKLMYVLVFLAQGSGPVDAIKQSWRLTAGKFWRTLGYYLVGYLVVNVATTVVLFISYFIMLIFLGVAAAAGSASTDPSTQVLAMLGGLAPGLIIMFVLNGAMALITIPFMTIYSTLMYRDQLVRDANPGMATATGPSFTPTQAQRPYGQPAGYGTPYGAPGQAPAPAQPGTVSGYGQPGYGQGSAQSGYGAGSASSYGSAAQPYAAPQSYGSPTPTAGPSYGAPEGFGGASYGSAGGQGSYGQSYGSPAPGPYQPTQPYGTQSETPQGGNPGHPGQGG